MNIERYTDPFTGEEKYIINLTQGELRWIRFDMSIAIAHQKNLDSLEAFLYDTDEFA